MENSEITTRASSDADFHVEETPEGYTVRFTPIVFNVESQVLSSPRGNFVEIILPESYDSADKSDIRALFNHDPNLVMGRYREGATNNTMTFEKTEKGVRAVCQMPKTTWAADLAESIKRGDISGCSFRFWASGNDYEWTRDEARNILVGKLKSSKKIDDYSVVTYPAYTQTEDSVTVRSLEDFVANENTNSIDPDKQARMRMILIQSQI